MIRDLFKKEEPKWITTKPAMEDNWTACLQTLEGHSDSVYSMAFSPDGMHIASVSQDRTVKIWDAGSGACLQTLKGHSSVQSVAFSPDGKHIALVSRDHTVKIWDAGSSANLRTLEGYSSTVDSVTFSPDGKHVASASCDDYSPGGRPDRTVKIWVWDASSGACLQTLKGRLPIHLPPVVGL
jgi:WD40 repeat protein